MKYITDNEIAFNEYDDAINVAEILMNNGYVVMLSKEEQFIILNYIWSSHCNRNDVCFQSIEEIDF